MKLKFNVHGGHNSHVTGAAKYLNELTEDRKVKNEIIRLLKAQGHTVYDCTDDSGTTQNANLSNIVKKCNAHAVDLDISIHLNAGGGNGVETYIYPNSSAKDEATRICSKVSSALGIKNRGVKNGSNLYVVRSTNSPAILVECCFVDSKEDAERWDANKCAKAIVEAILNKTVSSGATVNTSKPTTSTSSGETYKLVASCKIYTNAANAKNRKSSVGTYGAGTYYVFNKADGMINITKNKGVAGGWINPNDNKVATSNTSASSGSYYKKYTGDSDSIVSALNSIGVDSSYKNREKIAKANGISGYSGTASQNTKMLSLLKQGKLKKAGSTSSSNTTTTSCYKKYTGSSGSLVDALKAIGVNSSYDNRKAIAKKNGISNYEGTASQNEKLLSLLKQGKLKK